MPNNRIHAYFQTHWDREWYEPFPLYQHRLAEVVKTILTLLDNTEATLPCFTLDGQTALLEDVKPLLTPPEIEALCQHLASGRLHVGPWFVMPDTVLVSAESLIRNLQLGIKTAQSYGAKNFTGYLPDTFGQPSSLPSLFQGMGIETAIVWRGRGLNGQKSAFFQWESPNGQRVLTYQLAEGYFHLFLHDEILSTTEKLAELDSLIQKLGRFETHEEPFLLPLGGDHLGPPEADVLAAFHQYLSTVKVVHPHQFMANAKTWLAKTNAEIPLHQGSLRTFASKATEAPFLLTGTLSARMNLKLANAKLEHRLTHQTERQLAWVAIANPKKSPVGTGFTLAKAWELLLLNHPHDSICGCSLDEVHRANQVRFDEANAYAEGLERRTQEALGINKTGLHGWNGSTVTIAGVLPITLKVEKTATAETEADVLVRLAQQVPKAQFYSVKSSLVEAYKTDFRQVPLSHLTQWVVHGWMSIEPENALPALSVVNNVITGGCSPTLQKEVGQYQSSFFTIEWDEKSFSVANLSLPSYRVKADVGDSYNRQPSTESSPFLLKTVAVNYKTSQAAQWQLQFQTPEGDCLTQTILCVADEPVLSIRTQFTPNRPFIAVEMVLTEANFPQEIKAYQQVGWEVQNYTAEALAVRRNAFPVATVQDEWEALGGIFQAGLQTPTHYLWQAGCYAYEVEATAVIVPLHRGVGVLSGGRMPVRGCPAGPPFETPEGQCVGETFLFEALWGRATVLDKQLPLVQKAKARLLGDAGLKGKLAVEKLDCETATIVQLWETEAPLPVAIELQACYPKRDEAHGDGIIFRWHNPTNQAIHLPLPKNKAIWLCNLKDERLEPVVIPPSAKGVEIPAFSWLTVWYNL